MKEIIDIHLNGQFYLSDVIRNDEYDIYYSNNIDDEYWNFAYLKSNKFPLKEIYENIKNDMQKINRKPVIYITSDIVDSKLREDINRMNLKLLYTDVWMTLDRLDQFKFCKSKIDFITYRVDKNLEAQFIEAVMNGFSTDNPEDPYESLSDGYRVALKESFDKNNSEYKIMHYLGKKEKESISTATVIYKNQKAIIYNVTTNKLYQRNGVCKQMMSDIINDLLALNINEICVQTELGFYTEQVYKNMGFKERFVGSAYVEGE